MPRQRGFECLVKEFVSLVSVSPSLVRFAGITRAVVIIYGSYAWSRTVYDSVEQYH